MVVALVLVLRGHLKKISYFCGYFLFPSFQSPLLSSPFSPLGSPPTPPVLGITQWTSALSGVPSPLILHLNIMLFLSVLCML